MARGALVVVDGLLSLLIVFLEIARHVVSPAHLPHEPFVETFGGIHAAVLQQVIHRDHFGDHRDVFARVERHTHHRYVDVEDALRLAIETGAVDRRLVIPLLELDDDLDALLLANGANPEEPRNVDEADTADLHVMPLELMPTADQHVAPATAHDDEIVRHQTVASFDEVEHALRFADSTSPNKEQPDTEDVGERTVDVRGRRELFLEPRLEPVVELVRLELGADQRDIRGRRQIAEIGSRLLTLRDEHARDRERKESLEIAPAHVGLERLEIRDLGLAQHLETFRWKTIDVTRQHEAGTRGVRVLDESFQSVRGGDLLQLQRIAHPLDQAADGELGRHARLSLPPAAFAMTRDRCASVWSAARSQVKLSAKARASAPRRSTSSVSYTHLRAH